MRDQKFKDLIDLWTFRDFSLQWYRSEEKMMCRKYAECKNPKVERQKTRRIMILSKRAVCDSKKSKFIKEQEPNEL